MAENTSGNWFEKALETATTIAGAYFTADAMKQQAQIQNSIADSTIEENKQSETTIKAKNILIVVGGTIGLLLVYKLAVNVLK